MGDNKYSITVRLPRATSAETSISPVRRVERYQRRKDASHCKTADFRIRSRHRLPMLLYFVPEGS